MIETSLSLLPPRGVLSVGAIYKEGARTHGIDEWRKHNSQHHLDRALQHIYLHLAGDTGEDHLVNAGCRLLMCIEKNMEEKEANK